MTVLRCTATLLQRMCYPPKPDEPEPHRNPLGEWYADLLVWKRHPNVVLLNAATGVVMVLPGRAADLVCLSFHAQLHFELLCHQFELRGKGVEAETGIRPIPRPGHTITSSRWRWRGSA